jgi:hypothetical protein
MAACLACVSTLAGCSRSNQPVNKTHVEASAAEPTRSVDAAQGPSNTSTEPASPIYFAWKPAAAKTSEYAMQDPRDQHRMLLMPGARQGGAYPVVVALHGQPRRGQLPRNYAFPNVVAQVARQLIERHAVRPFVLVTPVFRFEGQNWPSFQLAAFMKEVAGVLSRHGITAEGTYVVGHSGAAGCGGSGLNRASDASPRAVGFFDTCVGPGFLQEVRTLAKMRIPTLIIHSVETAGFSPRQPIEYEADFDFGEVYSNIGLFAVKCPPFLPDAPLRKLAFRCATNDAATTQAFVVDTGQGEKAHEALVPVAFSYFLRKYLAPETPREP